MSHSPFHADDSIARRAFLGRAARAAFGITLLDGVAGQVARGATTDADGVNIIYLMMKGAMSHIDTFDPKPGREEQGETNAIGTAVSGVQFGEHVPKLAGMADRLAVIRSMTTETGAHEQGTYLMRTSYPQLNSIRHPAFGAWAVHALGKRAGDLPGYVLVGNGNEHPGCGFFDPALTPVPIADPQRGLENIRRPSYLTQANFDRRLALADRLDRDFRTRHAGRQIESYDRMYADAVQLMGSSDLAAFDLSREDAASRGRYGQSRFGQGCLLARRLVESGVRCVEVEMGGWDMHRDLWDDLPKRAGELDAAMAALLDDLQARGLLASTLVVLATEFGRSPKVNENAGRDHHPGVFSCVLAGAGVKPGVVHGASDKAGRLPDRDGVGVGDFNATIAAAAGIPWEREFIAPNGRPFRIGNEGKPIADVLA